jgi:hypothetical protein
MGNGRGTQAQVALEYTARQTGPITLASAYIITAEKRNSKSPNNLWPSKQIAS